MTSPRARVCKDCGNRRRKATYPGPRCRGCNTEYKSRTSEARHGTHVETNFGITEAEYQAILKSQGGACYMCRRKPGKQRLAVDHDHKCTRGHPSDKGCRYCIRGLLCKNCNRNILGRLHDSVEALQRGIDYLTNPPARVVLALMRRISE